MSLPEVLLDLYPWPPQSNNLFRDRMFRINGQMVTRGRAKSNEYKKYEVDVAAWASRRQEVIRNYRREALPILATQRYWIRIDSLYCLPHSMIWSKPKRKGATGQLKRMDAMNRLKAQYDTLSDVLEIEDLFFYPGVTRKVLLAPDEGTTPCVTMKLTLTTIPSRKVALTMLAQPKAEDTW